MADGPDHEPARDDLLVTGRYRATVLEPVVDHANRGHGAVGAVAEELDRRTQELQRDPPAGGAGRALSVAPQDVHVAACGGLEVVGKLDVDLGRIDDDVDARQLAELAQLRVGERGLRRTPAPEDDHLADRGAGEGLDGMVGGVGGSELVGVEHQHAGDVEGDVPVADHDGALTRQVERLVRVGGVAVVPGDELGGGDRPRAIVAGDPEPVVGGRADGVHDCVVAPEQLRGRHVGADLDTAEEAEVRVLRGLLVDARHRLDLRVVGRDAGADEPVGRRQRIEQVDGDPVPEQVIGGVEAGRAGPDDGGASGHRTE